MKKLFQKAFTLVELLIVIAIIGILAVAVLVALDPIEQTNRATDVQFTTAQGEVKNAIQRYYAGKLRYPWCATSAGGTTCSSWITGCSADVTGIAFSAGCPAAVLAELVSAGELKSTLSTTVQGRLLLTTTGTGANYWVMFDPISKNESTYEANGTFFKDTGCSTAGNNTVGNANYCHPSGAAGAGASAGCYQCIQ